MLPEDKFFYDVINKLVINALPPYLFLLGKRASYVNQLLLLKPSLYEARQSIKNSRLKGGNQ